MHDFFRRRAEPFDIPSRVHALLIDGEDGEFALFDAVDAHVFDQHPSTFHHEPGSWRQRVDRAPIYTIEVNASDGMQVAIDWLSLHSRDALPEWSQIELVSDPKGEADVYNNIAGPPQRVRISVRPLSGRLAQTLERATDLTPDVRPEAEIERALPNASIEQVFVLDVGQGSASALVNFGGEVVAYVDLGAGVLRDIGTSPASMRGICLQHTPTVILTHSYGYNNSYQYPLKNSVKQLTGSRWIIGHPAAGIDERRTEDRPGGTGGMGLGHIRLNWTGGTGPAHGCACGCTLDPTQ
jgi:hypothetical protein